MIIAEQIPKEIKFYFENFGKNNTDYLKYKYIKDEESAEYLAYEILNDNNKYFFRKAKLTDKKLGHFVTFWKRNNSKKVIEPFEDIDNFELLIVCIEIENNFSYFIFNKNCLIKQKILTHNNIEGKRAFRVYAPSIILNSKQAISTQKWQKEYFIK